MQARKVFLTILFLSITICFSVIAQSKPSENDYLLQRIGVDAKIIPYVGIAIPLGEFPKGDFGAAETGFSVGMQFIHNAKFGPVIQCSYSSNKTGYSAPSLQVSADSWKNTLVLGGVKLLSGEISGIGEYYAAPLAGIIVSQKAKIVYNWQGYYDYSITKASNTTFAWGATAGISVKRFTLNVTFTYADTKYESNVEDLVYALYVHDNTNVTKLNQKTEILQVNLGYAL
jgi:hypothetical protein